MADVSAYDPVFEAAGNEWNVNPQLLKAMAIQESGGNPRAVSRAGALGVMQIMPDTAKTLGITDPTDPVQSIYGAAKYMNRALDKEGSVEDALRNYHGGDGWRQAYGPESQGYVPAVTKHYQILGQFKAALADPDPSVRTDATTATAPALAAPGGAGNAMASNDPLSLLPPAPKPSAGGGATTAAPDDPLSLLPPAPKPTGAATTTATQETAPAQDPYSGAPTSDDYQPSPAVTGAFSRIGQAAAEGAAEGPHFPRVPGNLVMSAVYNPLIAGAETAFRGVSALGRGGMQAIYEAGEPAGRAMPEIRIPDVTLPGDSSITYPGGITIDRPGRGFGGTVAGGPGLGRDLNVLAQVVPVAQAESSAMRASMQPPVASEVNALQPKFVSERFAPAREPGATDLERIQQLIRHDEAESVGAGPETQAGAAGGGSAAQPVGAQTTPASAAQMTPEQIATRRTVADKKWLNQTQQPGVRDTTEHIKGITPNLVEQEQTVTAARELKSLKNLNPELSQAEREILDHNTDLRKGHYADTVGSDVSRAADLKAANDKINTDLAEVWKGKGEADPAGVHTQIETELAGSAGDLPPVKSAMKQVSDSLENAGSDPQAMYRTHRLINYLQSKQGQLANPGYGAGDVQAALTRVKGTLAKTIDDAAPGFDKAMSDYAGARGPIDAAKALQDRENGLYDTRGHMSFLKVHALMRDIIDAQKWDAPNDPLAGVSEAQMARLKALHDDLKRTASAKDLATAQGSDTAMNAVDIAKAYGKLATRAGVEGAANVAFGPGVGSMIVRGAENLLRPITSGIAARGQMRRGMEILQPRPGNPLQP